MDRLFLDANILFSAAYRPTSALGRFWDLRNASLCSSRYGVEEASANLTQQAQERRLRRLVNRLELIDARTGDLPEGLVLPEKDIPIFLAAMAAHATHLITGDIRHFGNYFGQSFAGILIEKASTYLQSR
jgi:uncharacterized protein